MEDFIRIFKTSEGDVLHITLSENNEVLSKETVDELKDVVLVGVDLRRLQGNQTVSQRVISAIANAIAEFYLSHENAIICYYCDFVNPIPRTNKNSMPPQEYRSLLFEKMFHRYMKLHHLSGIGISVVEINGINEKYYFHVIYRESQSMLASIIGNDLKDGFEK